jgi:surface antigen
MAISSMKNTAKLASFAALLSLAANPANAQFSGLNLPTLKSQNTATTSDGCPKGKKKSIGSSLLGNVLGKVARDLASDAGVSRWIPISDVSDQLSNAIACRLDPEEQKQAAEATLAATRGDQVGLDAEVGSSASWISATRNDVSGSSTVVASNDDDTTGLQCITVTDVIIVKGEETTANKRMCRPPGSARYSLVA